MVGRGLAAVVSVFLLTLPGLTSVSSQALVDWASGDPGAAVENQLAETLPSNVPSPASLARVQAAGAEFRSQFEMFQALLDSGALDEQPFSAVSQDGMIESSPIPTRVYRAPFRPLGSLGGPFEPELPGVGGPGNPGGPGVPTVPPLDPERPRPPIDGIEGIPELCQVRPDLPILCQPFDICDLLDTFPQPSEPAPEPGAIRVNLPCDRQIIVDPICAWVRALPTPGFCGDEPVEPCALIPGGAAEQRASASFIRICDRNVELCQTAEVPVVCEPLDDPCDNPTVKALNTPGFCGDPPLQTNPCNYGDVPAYCTAPCDDPLLRALLLVVPGQCGAPPIETDPCDPNFIVGVNAPGLCGEPLPSTNYCDYYNDAPGTCGNPPINICTLGLINIPGICGEPLPPTDPCEYYDQAPGTCHNPLPPTNPCDANFPVGVSVPGLCGEPLPNICALGLNVPATCGNPPPPTNVCSYYDGAPGTCGNPLPPTNPCSYVDGAPGTCGNPPPNTCALFLQIPGTCGEPLPSTRYCDYADGVPGLCGNPLPNLCTTGLNVPGTCGEPLPEVCDLNTRAACVDPPNLELLQLVIAAVQKLLRDTAQGDDLIQSDDLDQLVSSIQASSMHRGSVQGHALDLQLALAALNSTWAPHGTAANTTGMGAAASIGSPDLDWTKPTLDAAQAMAVVLVDESADPIETIEDVRQFGAPIQVISSAFAALQEVTPVSESEREALQHAIEALENLILAMASIDYSASSSAAAAEVREVREFSNDDGTREREVDIDFNDDSAIKHFQISASEAANAEVATLLVYGKASQCGNSQVPQNQQQLTLNGQPIDTYNPCARFPTTYSWVSFAVPVQMLRGGQDVWNNFGIAEIADDYTNLNSQIAIDTSRTGTSYIVENGAVVNGELMIRLRLELRIDGAPNACFEINPWQATGTPETWFVFNASCSSDAETPAGDLEVAWDWQSDGSLDTLPWTKTKTIAKQFPPGTHLVTLHVKDGNGVVDTASANVFITGNGPQPCLTVSPPSGMPSTSFFFDASCSTDQQDPLSSLQFYWDWATGQDVGWTSNPTVNHVFGVAGDHLVTLRVKDRDGNVGETTRVVSVGGGGMPSPCFTASRGSWRTPVEVSAACSTDAELGCCLTFAWDWNNDNIDDTWPSESTGNSHLYTTPGSYTIGLRVKDPDGNTARTTRTVTVVSTEVRISQEPWRQTTLYGQGAQPHQGMVRMSTVDYEQASGAAWSEIYGEGYYYYEPAEDRTVSFNGFEDRDGNYYENYVDTRLSNPKSRYLARPNSNLDYYTIEERGSDLVLVEPRSNTWYTWWLIEAGARGPEGTTFTERYMMLLPYFESPSEPFWEYIELSADLKTIDNDAHSSILGKHTHEAFRLRLYASWGDSSEFDDAAQAAEMSHDIFDFLKGSIESSNAGDWTKLLEWNTIGFLISWFLEMAESGDVAKILQVEKEIRVWGTNVELEITRMITVPNLNPIPFMDGGFQPGHMLIKTWEDDVAFDTFCRVGIAETDEPDENDRRFDPSINSCQYNTEDPE